MLSLVKFPGYYLNMCNFSIDFHLYQKMNLQSLKSTMSSLLVGENKRKTKDFHSKLTSCPDRQMKQKKLKLIGSIEI